MPRSAVAASSAKNTNPADFNHLRTSDCSSLATVISASPITAPAAKLCKRSHGECAADSPSGDPTPAMSAPATNETSVATARAVLNRPKIGVEVIETIDVPTQIGCPVRRKVGAFIENILPRREIIRGSRNGARPIGWCYEVVRLRLPRKTHAGWARPGPLDPPSQLIRKRGLPCFKLLLAPR